MDDYLSPSFLGHWGEDEAARYLTQRGLRVVNHHYQKKWGEIDLICRDGETWVFVEVKTRTSRAEPSAMDSVTLAKRKRLVRAALSYMKWKRLEGCAMRFDLVLIEAGRIEWLSDAFEPPSYYTY
jgi:putative endonuclease